MSTIHEILKSLVERVENRFLNFSHEGGDMRRAKQASYIDIAATKIEAEIIRRTREYKPPVQAEEEPKFVLMVTDSDGEVYYCADNDNPYEAFGTQIQTMRYRLVDPVPVPEYSV